METFWGIISLLLGIGFIGTVGLIAYMVIRAFFAVRRGHKQADVEREKSRVEMESLNSEAIRSKLLSYGYFTASLRAPQRFKISCLESRTKKTSCWRQTIPPKNRFMECFTKRNEKRATAVARSVLTTTARYSTYYES